MKILRAIDGALGKLEEWAAIGLLMTILGLAVVQVAARNILHQGLIWADVAVRELTFFLGIAGAAMATRQGRHITIDVLGKLLSKRNQIIVAIVTDLFAATACGWLTLAGYYQVADAFKKETELVLGPLRAWHLQTSIPIGFALFTLHFVLRVIYDFARLLGKAADEPDGPVVAHGVVVSPLVTAPAADTAAAPAAAPAEVSSDKPKESAE